MRTELFNGDRARGSRDAREQTAARERNPSRSRSSIRGKLDTDEMEKRLAQIEDIQTGMGHLVITHDTRLRELSTLFRSLLIPKDSGYGKLLCKVERRHC